MIERARNPKAFSYWLEALKAKYKGEGNQYERPDEADDWSSKSMDGPYWKTINFIMSIWTGGDFENRAKLCQNYRDHYAHIRAIVPQERILEFKLKDGWSELCKFLHRPIPVDEPGPHINQPDNIIMMHTIV
ncbi:MAG: hypothetical protein L6R41_000376 [Letrouitia leprolyta]|nr:MAG: hypothetical protein L6R41_000376 [Letrouitia leprolyta]